MYEKNDRFDDTLQIPTQIFYGEEDAVMAWAMRTPNAQPGRPDFVNPGVFRMFQFYREYYACLLYTSPSPRDISGSRMPSSA